jgi:hypothetical protein
MNAYSLDLRLKVLDAVDRGIPRREVVRTFGVSMPTLERYLRRRRQTGGVAPKPSPGRTPSTFGQAPRNWGKNLTLICSLDAEGIGAAMSVEGATDGAAFETYVRHFLAPMLKRGQLVVMDNLQVHKMRRVRELLEGAGAEVLFLAPYSPDFSPIEEAFSRRARASCVGSGPEPARPC